MAQHAAHQAAPNSIIFTIGGDQIIISRRYQVVSILNDFLIGAWFLVGSWLFFYPQWETAGTWCFVIGSAQLLIRPVIRLSHHIHVSRRGASEWDM